jgi:hypothetical protein
LSFYSCNLTDANIIAFSKYCSNLQVFIVQHIESITDESIIAITKNCNILNKLNIESCENIKNKGFTMLFAVLVSVIVLAVGASIISIALKQVVLSGIGRESQYAFSLQGYHSKVECLDQLKFL